MSKGIAELMDAVASDEQLKEALSAAQSIDELVAIAAANGYEVSAADVAEAVTPEREVDDAELEGVAGGAKSGVGIYGICSAGFTAPAILPTDCR